MNGSRVAVIPLAFGLMIILLALSLLSLTQGTMSIELGDVATALWGAPPQDDDSQRLSYVLLQLRFPRLVAALLAGACLAASGTLMQGLFRNPLAGPDVMGVSSGASLGALLAITGGLSSLAFWVLPLSAVIGALAVATLMYVLALGRRHGSLVHVVLSGMALSGIINGLVSMILLFSRQYEVSEFVFWTMGGLEGRNWSQISYALPLMLPALVVAFVYTSRLDILGLGEEQAHAAGLGVERDKRVLLLVAAVLTAMAISMAGPVAFIGLLVPHVFRSLCGPGHRTLLPLSVLGGATFLLAADLLGRIVVPPYEIKAGIVTALLGGPFFLALILSRRKVFHE